jgi:tetraacyldisaccharide 4'-kinase
LSRFDSEAYFRLIRGETHGPWADLARGGLWLASVAYGAAAWARNCAYDRYWLRSHRVAVPVVSVGNLTVGGTGKTPMVEWLARWFRRRGVRVAILSRGYRQTEGPNDEGRVLQDNLPDVPYLEDPDRVALAHLAALELETELVILDDGFQHRRLARDVDIVLLDALEPFGLGYLLPRGLLRESAGSLKRASLVVLSRADLVSPERRALIRQIAERQIGFGRWVESRHAPLELIDGEGGLSPVESISPRSVAAFCGIGNPEGFRHTLQSLYGNLVDFRVFPDHHHYTAADVGRLERWAGERGADLVLTTQKDLVKLRASFLGPTPLRALRIGLEITAGCEIMDDVLARFVPVRLRDEPLEKEFS